MNQIEEELEKIIESVDNQLKQAKNFIQNNPDIILLVGTTGCGKSTIFNWLIDADFKLQTQNYTKQLCASHLTKKIALMSSKIVSETKQIQYDYIQDCNFVVIDFPGFQFTNGQQNDFQTDLVLYKLTQDRQIKIIYIIEQQGNEISNRGSDFQKFINSSYFSNNHQSDISIILNKYNEDLNETDIKECFIKQLQECNGFKQQQPDNIYTIRKINTETKLQEEFSKQKTKAFKYFLMKSKKLNLKLRQLSNTELIDQYIIYKKYCLLNSYQNIMQQFESILKDNYVQADIQINNNKIKQQISKLKQDNQMKELTLVQSFDLILKITQQIWNQFENEDKIFFNCQKLYSKFQRIFEFYYQFQNQIKSYQDCQQLKDFLLQDYNTFMDKIKQFIQQKKQQKKEEERIRQEKIKMEQEEKVKELSKMDELERFKQKEDRLQQKEQKLREKKLRIQQQEFEYRQNRQNNITGYTDQIYQIKFAQGQIDEQIKQMQSKSNFKNILFGSSKGLLVGIFTLFLLKDSYKHGSIFGRGSILSKIASEPQEKILMVSTGAGALIGLIAG